MTMKYLNYKIITLLVVLAVFAPGLGGYQKVDAQSVVVTGNTSLTDVTTSLRSTLSAISNAVTAAETQALVFKETVLDPLAWLQSKEAQNQLQADLLKWLGGQQPGQGGVPPFIQSLSEEYQSIADQVAGQYIVSEVPEGQCSTEQTHQMRTAALAWYSDNQSGGESNICLPDRPEDLDAMDALFLSYTDCKYDTSCGALRVQHDLARNIQNAQANAAQEINISRGFRPNRVCENVENASGVDRLRCYITNPLSLAADATSFQLGELPALQLLNTDEFNEAVSGFMSNLTNQALGSITGILGLSGNPSYSANVFGPDGNLSYVDALASENIASYQAINSTAIKESLAAEGKYIELQEEILDAIAELEEEIEEGEEDAPSCFDLELTEELEEAKELAEDNLRVSTTTLQILITLDDQYDNAEDGATKNAIMSTYQQYLAQGLFRTEIQNQELELTYVDFEFADLVQDFEIEIAREKNRCNVP